VTGQSKEVIYKLPLSQFEPGCRWRIQRLAEAADTLGGGTPDTAIAEFWSPAEIPWATPTDITATEGNEIRTTARQISTAGLKHSTLVPENAILMTSRATIGAAKINRVPMAINQGFAALVPKAGYSTEYLFHLIHVIKPTLVRLGAGTTFLETSRREIKKIEVKLPDEYEQRRIASALKLADDAIAKAQAELEATRNLKRSLIHELLCYGACRKDSIVYTKLGPVPEKWEIKTLADHCGTPECVKTGPFGAQLPPEVFDKQGMRFVNITDIGEGVLDFSEEIYLKNEEAERLRDYRLLPGDLVFSRVASVGRVALIPEMAGPYMMSSNCIRLRGSAAFDPPFLNLLFLCSEFIRRQVAAMSTGGARPIVTPRFLRKVLIARPPRTEQEEITELAQAVDKRIATAAAQVRATEVLKRSLLQNLLTGKIRLPEGVIHG
jgi:type I restriction enzyme S subunit